MKKKSAVQTGKKPKGGFAAVALCVLIAALAAFSIRTFGFQFVLVRSDAMGGTLCPGDVVLLSRSAQPERGQVVYAAAINGGAFRRVIGQPGDSVTAANGAVTVNGARLYEPYAVALSDMSDSQAELSQGVYLLMADDRSNAAALVEAGGMAGVARAVVWPLSRAGFL